jgi:uncharacterized protein (TIGR02145 family)
MKTKNAMRSFFSIISCVLFLFLGCKDTSSTNPDDTTLKDSIFIDTRDNVKYRLVKIGTQVWMADNLESTHYHNGDSIRYAPTNEDWIDAAKKKEGAWCYYNNDKANNSKYGKLYNYYAEQDPRDFTPIGYHKPTDAEWLVLTNYLGGEKIAGFKMKSTTGWDNNGNGDNSTGFNAVPAGYRYNTGGFDNMGKSSLFWSSTPHADTNAWTHYLTYYNGEVYFTDKVSKNGGLSIRCIRD